MTTRRHALAAAVALAAATTPALADPVTAGQWYEFAFGNPGSFATTCIGMGCTPSSGGNSVFAPDAPWTFTSPAPFTLTVTDAFLRNNSFTIFNSGAIVGSTPAPAGLGSCGDDPAVCLLDPGVSHAAFALAAGDYSFTIRSDAGTGGAAYFRIDRGVAVVPEPTTVVLLAGGLAAMAGVAARRRRTAA